MSNDPTNNLHSGDKLDQIISMVQTTNQRLNDLEAKVDERLKETRPIWEAVQSQLQQMDARLTSVETQLQEMNARLNKLDEDLISGLRKVEYKIEHLNESFLEMGGKQRDLRKRVEDLESKVS